MGYVLRPHGLKGEVTLSLDDDFPEELDELDTFFVEAEERLVPYFIEHISTRGDRAFVKFEGVESAEEAAKISKSAVYLPKAFRRRSGPDKIFADELIGCRIHHGSDILGKVTGVMRAGSNQLLVVEAEGGKEVLIPVSSPFITEVDKQAGKITVSLPDGFLDI